MARVKTQPLLLISILDPIGQEGLTKGALVLEKLQKTSITVCTAIANQNDIEVDNITWLSFDEIKRQLNAIGRRYWIDWAIISGIYDLTIVSNIVNYLQASRPGLNIIWMPSIDADEQRRTLTTQEAQLFFSICDSVFLSICSRTFIKRLPEPSTEVQCGKRLSLKSNAILIHPESNKANLLCTQSGEAKLIPSSETTELFCSTPFLTSLGAFLHEGLDIEEAYQQALEFCESYSIN